MNVVGLTASDDEVAVSGFPTALVRLILQQ